MIFYLQTGNHAKLELTHKMNFANPEPFHVWNFFLDITILLAVLMPLSAWAASNVPEHDLRKWSLWRLIPLVVGVLLEFGFPYNLLVFNSLFAGIGFGGGSTFTLIFAIVFSIACWIISWNIIFGRLLAFSKQRR